MENIQVFNNEEFGAVRVAEINEEPYFCLIDVCRILELTNSRMVKQRLNPKGVNTTYTLTNGGKQEMTFINESNLYKVIFQSRKAEAERFTDWVTSDVLPAIRKHGGYLTAEKIEEAILNPDTLIRLATTLKEEQEKNKRLQIINSELTVDNQIMKPKAEYFDDLADRNLLTSIRETAKELKIKERDFINFLVDKKYLYRDKKGKLVPYAKKNNGLFEVKEFKNNKTSYCGVQTLITPKGRETFRLLI